MWYSGLLNAMEKLTLQDRQRLFALEYVKTGNADRAAKNAGYTTQYADGKRLLATKRVKAHILEIRNNADNVMKATEVLNELSSIGRDSRRDGDRVKALEILAKYHGLLIERKETGGPGAFSNWTNEKLDKEIKSYIAERETTQPEPERVM